MAVVVNPHSLTLNDLLGKIPRLLLVELIEEAKEHGSDPGVELSEFVPASGPRRWVVFLPWMSADPVQIPVGTTPPPRKPPTAPKGGLLIYEAGADRVLRAHHLEGEFFFVAADEIPTAPPKGDLEHDPLLSSDDEDTKMWIMDRYGKTPSNGPGPSGLSVE